jgi:cytochrome P450
MTTVTQPSRDQMIWIRGHDEAMEILKSTSFTPSLHQRGSAPILKDCLITLHGDEHTRRRRTEIVMFSRPALREYEFSLVVPALRESLAEARTGHDGAVKVDLLRVMKDALLRVSARVVGLDGVVTMADTDRLRDIAERLGEGAAVEWSTTDTAPILASAMQAKDDLVQEFYGESKDRREGLVAQWRAGELAEDELPNDLLTILLKSYDHWDEDKLLRECVFFLIASASTTTHSAPHVLWELVQLVVTKPETGPRAATLSYLQRAVSEALRLHPPVPALLRVVAEDIQLRSGRQLRAGDNVAIDLNAVNRDASVFGESAEAFDPERSLGTRSHLYGASFGAGAHVCPGRLVAVGGGNGNIERDDQAAGVLVRLMEELYRHGVTIDPADPPALRLDTTAGRYATFPVLIGGEVPHA